MPDQSIVDDDVDDVVDATVLSETETEGGATQEATLEDEVASLLPSQPIRINQVLQVVIELNSSADVYQTHPMGKAKKDKDKPSGQLRVALNTLWPMLQERSAAYENARFIGDPSEMIRLLQPHAESVIAKIQALQLEQVTAQAAIRQESTESSLEIFYQIRCAVSERYFINSLIRLSEYIVKREEETSFETLGMYAVPTEELGSMSSGGLPLLANIAEIMAPLNVSFGYDAETLMWTTDFDEVASAEETDGDDDDASED